MTNEYVYQINAPHLADILLPGIEEKLFVKTDKMTYKVYQVADLVKPEYLTWNNIEWETVNVFHKTTGHVGRIHIDNIYGKFMWGVNWIYNGWGDIKYWEKQDVDTCTELRDEQGFMINKYTVSKLPSKQYKFVTGSYLVNASVPHLPSGNDNRYAFSIRPKHFNLDWEGVISKFQPLIRPW